MIRLTPSSPSQYSDTKVALILEYPWRVILEQSCTNPYVSGLDGQYHAARVIQSSAGKTMNTFSTSAVTTRPTDDVLQAALATLTNNGFAIVNCDKNSANLTGPRLNSTKQNPLLGATAIHLELHGQQLRLEAELGGVDAMRRFLMRFPFMLGLGLGLFFGVAGGVVFGRQFGVGFGVPWAQGLTWMLLAIGAAMLPVTPWLFLSPMMSKMIRTRTQNALTTLVTNAVQMPKNA